MAFFLTPRTAPAYNAQQCNPWGYSSRPQQTHRRIIRPSPAPLNPFFSEIDELLSALDHEARQEVHRQRQLRKRIVRAHFNVHENEGAYQIDAEIAGFDRDHIEIDVTDDNTLKVSGNTERRLEQPSQAPAGTTESEAQHESIEGVTLNKTEEATTEAESPAHSDTESHKSYQATVEDDFEDLGAETSSTASADSNTPERTNNPALQQPPRSDFLPTPQEQQEVEDEWRFQGSFARTFRFPERIDAANVRAGLRNGLLSITVPKAKAPAVRRISIQ